MMAGSPFDTSCLLKLQESDCLKYHVYRLAETRENSSQPADIPGSPPAAAGGGDSPSQLLGAFIHYLRARPTRVDFESTGFDDSPSGLEGVIRGTSDLGGVPAVTLEPQVGCPDRTILYFHGGGYVSGSPPERTRALAARATAAANGSVHLSPACHAQRCGPANAGRARRFGRRQPCGRRHRRAPGSRFGTSHPHPDLAVG